MSTVNRFLAWLGRPERSMRRCGDDRGDLRRDQSGAIMVAGVFMAVLLAAAIFLIIGTGDAIVYRERVQDAADAVAYTSAGIHARGMNIIVLINLIMVALMALLVAIKMLIVIIGILIAVCTAISILTAGILAAICGPVISIGTETEEWLNEAADYYQDFLDVALPILSKTEAVIAITTPWVGLAKGIKVANVYKPRVTSGFSVSPSMVPFAPDTAKLGLPVTEMFFDKFCKKAAEKGVQWAFFWAPSWFKDGASKFAGWVAGSFPGFFCGGSGKNGGETEINKTSYNDLQSIVDKTCSAAKDQCFKDKQASSFCEDDGGGVFTFNSARCNKETKEKVKESLDKNLKDGKGKIDPGSGKFLDFSNKTPKDIWSTAENGNFWMQVWGITFGDESWPRRNDKGIALASKAGLPKPDTAWGNFRVAQAEFYFDAKGEWSKMKEECMFEMAWRVRLRRFDLSDISIGEGFVSGMFQKALNYSGLKGIVEKWGNGSGTIGAIFKNQMYEVVSDKLKEMFSKVVGGAADKLIQGAIPNWELIH
jgi:hypothetical protein